ncbi:MAG: hypothetical protein M1491_00515 [Deltaproteobacteria bacterium]|nr:hypothetical protein [Deltaproteobacteria bacterium]MCL5278273.1 hypothetical protein [Deltaproteobacteria bacterium]
MNTKKGFIVLAVLGGLIGLMGCSSSSQKQTVQPGQQVTLTGLMQQGSLSATSLASYGTGMHLLGTALANYKLYCVTFEDSPVGAKGTADNSGKFSLSIKSYTPFGCFVLDASDNHVADLLFAGLGTSSGTYSGSIMLTNNANVGTITVDPSTGMAVVNVAGVGGVAGNNITGTAFDPTGSWIFACTSPAGDPVYSCPIKDIPPSLYLHRISGIFSSDGKRHYGMGVWASAANFTVCGSVEGIAVTTGTAGKGPGGQTITLDSPDGPLQFAYDNVWQAALDSQIHNTFGACGAPVTLTCSQVTNLQGWGPPSPPGTPPPPPWTDPQCQQLCYANGFEQIKRTLSYCIEDRNYLWNQYGMQNMPFSAPTTDNNTPFIDFDGHNPVGRFMFGELIYSSDTTGSEVYTDYRIDSLFVPMTSGGGTSYTCPINGVTKLAFSEVNANTLVGTVDQYMTLAAGSPTECTNTTIPNNYVLQDLKGMHMMFKLTR